MAVLTTRLEWAAVGVSAALSLLVVGNSTCSQEPQTWQQRLPVSMNGELPEELPKGFEQKCWNSLQLQIVADETVNDNVLHDLGTLTQAELNFLPTDTVGIGDDDWIAFRVTHGTIGRRQDQVLTGPDGVSGSDDSNQFVAYHLSVVNGTTAAPSVSGHTRVVSVLEHHCMRWW